MSADLPSLPAEKATDSDAMLVERTVAGDQKALSSWSSSTSGASSD
jgi:hypothetical protein